MGKKTIEIHQEDGNIAEIRQLANGILEDKKKWNDILELLGYLKTDSDKLSSKINSGKEQERILTEVVHQLERIFDYMMSNGFLRLQIRSNNNGNAKNIVSSWLRANYTTFTDDLLLLLCSLSSQKMQIVVLRALLDSIKRNSLQMSEKNSNFVFDNDLYLRLVKALVSIEDPFIVGVFVEHYLGKYHDLLFYCYKNITKICQESTRSCSSWEINNLFALLMDMQTPDAQEEEEDNQNDGDEKANVEKLVCYVYKKEALENGARIAQKSHQRKLFSEAWLSFLSISDLTIGIYKSTLALMHDKIIPNMTEPRLLHAFLTTSYELGGSIGFLALKGLFVLVSKYNLDYPDFYLKLYQLLNVDVLHLKNRTEVLELVDIFLKSTHLPGYLVAAFLKKMARLALYAPPGGILCILPIMHNLVRRHKSAVDLLHRQHELISSGTTDGMDGAQLAAVCDPYDPMETDPAKCRANESCLWELLALCDHYHPEVAEYALKFKTPFEKKQILQDTKKYHSTNHGSLFVSEITKLKKPKLAYDKPESLFGSGGLISESWTF